MSWLEIIGSGLIVLFGIKLLYTIKRGLQHKKLIEATRWYVGVFNAMGGLPEGFWRDPYVLGFLHGIITFTAKAATRGKINGKELGRLIIRTISDLYNGKWHEVIDLIKKFHATKNNDYVEGFKNAEKIVFVCYQINSFDEDPDIIGAKKKIASEELKEREVMNQKFSGLQSNDSEKIAAQLTEELYLKRVLLRLGDDRINMFDSQL